MQAKNSYAVIFDMDGVLVDTEPVIEKAAILTLGEFGVTAKSEDFIPFIGTGEIKYIGGVAEKYGLAYQPIMKDRLYQIYLEIVDKELKIHKGAKECLKYLKENNIEIALASSSADRIKIDANLRVADISPTYFRIILGAEDVINKKPNPEIYLLAAKKLKKPASNCFVIEDALNGIQSAKAAGTICIAVTTTFTKEKLAQKNPDYICEDLTSVCHTIRTFIA
jgi:HAD superfamily hydrolase (TIGR01509 family)